MVTRTILLLTLTLAAGCASRPPADDLYRDLGGKPGITRIVDAFLVHLSEDELVVDTFADTDIAEFRRLLIEQLCDLSGGPCEYTGRTMAESHAGMGVTPAMFNALVADLIDAMDDAGVPQGAQNRLLGLLAPMHGDIVEGRAPGVGAGA